MNYISPLTSSPSTFLVYHALVYSKFEFNHAPRHSFNKSYNKSLAWAGVGLGWPGLGLGLSKEISIIEVWKLYGRSAAIGVSKSKT